MCMPEKLQELLDGVTADLGVTADMGRRGMTAESVLRSASLKQYCQPVYKEAAFSLVDSASTETFAHFPIGLESKKATLQQKLRRAKSGRGRFAPGF